MMGAAAGMGMGKGEMERSPHFEGAYVGGEEDDSEEDEEEDEELRAEVERDVGGVNVVAARGDGEDGGVTVEESGERSDPHGGALRRAREEGGVGRERSGRGGGAGEGRSEDR